MRCWLWHCVLWVPQKYPRRDWCEAGLSFSSSYLDPASRCSRSGRARPGLLLSAWYWQFVLVAYSRNSTRPCPAWATPETLGAWWGLCNLQLHCMQRGETQDIMERVLDEHCKTIKNSAVTLGDRTLNFLNYLFFSEISYILRAGAHKSDL